MIRKRYAALLAVAALAIGTTASAVTGPNVTTANVDVVRHSTGDVNLSGGGDNKTIMSLALPAGSWVVTADLSAEDNTVASTSEVIIHCGIYRGSTSLSSSVSSVVGAGSFTTINSIGAFKSASRASISIKCRGIPALDEVITILAGATLWAHRSSSLSS